MSHSNPLEFILSLSLSLPSTFRERGRKRKIPIFLNHLYYAMV